MLNLNVIYIKIIIKIIIIINNKYEYYYIAIRRTEATEIKVAKLKNKTRT